MSNMDIKKRLIVHSAAGAAALLVLAGGAYFVMMMAENYATEKQTLENDVNTLTNEIETQRNKFSKVRDNTGLYQELMKRAGDNRLALDRQAVREQLDMLRGKYYLGSLRLAVEPIQKVQGFSGTGSSIVSSEVSIAFSALTDGDVYNMMQAMQQSFPGEIKMTSLTLRQDTKVDNDSIKGLSQAGPQNFVVGELKFTWLGIQSLEPPKPPNAPNAPATN